MGLSRLLGATRQHTRQLAKTWIQEQSGNLQHPSFQTLGNTARHNATPQGDVCPNLAPHKCWALPSLGTQSTAQPCLARVCAHLGSSLHGASQQHKSQQHDRLL